MNEGKQRFGADAQGVAGGDGHDAPGGAHAGGTNAADAENVAGGERAKNNATTDPYPPTRIFRAPTRLVWISDDSPEASVLTPGILLEPRYGQVPEGRFLAGSGCRLENRGAQPSVLLDFGREIHGSLEIASGGTSDRGMTVRVRFGESVAEAMAELGERGAGNDHAIRDSEIALPWLGTREIGNTGFRFVRIDLTSRGAVSLESVRGISLMRAMPRLGSFRCSDERLNRIWETAVHTVHCCCQDFLWDGIKRDRLVWMGDTHPEMMAILSVFGNQPFLTRSLDYMRDTTPANGWMNGMPSYTLWWLRCQHDLFLHTGDLDYLRAQHGYITAVFEGLSGHIQEDGRYGLPKGFLDWPTEHNRLAVDAGMQALMLMAFEDGARMADAIGDGALAKRCTEDANRLKAFIPSAEGSKQAAALLALAGLRPADAMQRDVLGEGGVSGVSTFYGYYMLEAMAMAGEVQHGIDTIRTYWGGMLDMGATSFWEDFDLNWTKNAFRIDELPVAGKDDIHGDFGDFCYKGFRHSLCHGWASGPAPWLLAHVLGITVAAPGCSTVRVAPFLGDLEWAEGSFPTPQGVITVRHERRADGELATDVSGPEGVVIT